MEHLHSAWTETSNDSNTISELFVVDQTSLYFQSFIINYNKLLNFNNRCNSAFLEYILQTKNLKYTDKQNLPTVRDSTI